MQDRQRWSQRWQADNFYANHDPYQHFSTLVHHSPVIAQAIYQRILTQHSGPYDIFDLGSGSGALAIALRELCSPEDQVHAIDVRPRPVDLPTSITWHTRDLRFEPLPTVDNSRIAVVIAHEFFDDVPCDVVDVGDDGICRWREADHRGDPVTGSVDVDEPTMAWINRWWPPLRAGMSIDVGSSRDDLWRNLLSTNSQSIGIAIDYGHILRERLSGTWDAGTLAGYRNGYRVSPRLDGQTNVTAHVSMDSLASQSQYSTLMRLSEFVDQPTGSRSTGSLGDFLVAITAMQGCSRS